MKKLFAFAFLLLTSSSIFAQQKGDKHIVGSLNIATMTSILSGDATTSVDFGISPEFGFFVANKLKISLSAGYTLSYNNVASHTFIIGPGLAYYVRLADNFYYTPEFFIGFEYSANKYLDGCGLGIGLSIVGFEFKPKPNIGLAFNILSLGYDFFHSQILI